MDLDQIKLYFFIGVRILFYIIATLCGIATVIMLFIAFYEIAINVHDWYLQMTDNNRLFLLLSICTPAIVFLFAVQVIMLLNKQIEKPREQPES